MSYVNEFRIQIILLKNILLKNKLAFKSIHHEILSGLGMKTERALCLSKFIDYLTLFLKN